MWQNLSDRSLLYPDYVPILTPKPLHNHQKSLKRHEFMLDKVENQIQMQFTQFAMHIGSSEISYMMVPMCSHAS